MQGRLLSLGGGWLKAGGHWDQAAPAAPPTTATPPPPPGDSPSAKRTYPALRAAADQAETLPGECLLCFLSVASPGAELHRKEEGGEAPLGAV